MSRTANSRRFDGDELQEIARRARRCRPCRARRRAPWLCSSAVKTGLRTSRCRSALSAISASKRSRSAFTASMALALRAPARTARSHSGPPCRIRSVLRLPRRAALQGKSAGSAPLAWAAQALGIQGNFSIRGPSPNPAKIARLLTYRSLRCNMRPQRRSRKPRSRLIPGSRTSTRRSLERATPTPVGDYRPVLLDGLAGSVRARRTSSGAIMISSICRRRRCGRSTGGTSLAGAQARRCAGLSHRGL